LINAVAVVLDDGFPSHESEYICAFCGCRLLVGCYEGRRIEREWTVMSGQHVRIGRGSLLRLLEEGLLRSILAEDRYRSAYFPLQIRSSSSCFPLQKSLQKPLQKQVLAAHGRFQIMPVCCPSKMTLPHVADSRVFPPPCRCRRCRDYEEWVESEPPTDEDDAESRSEGGGVPTDPGKN
jgi:hypothetical protein